jgi:acyl-CoA thioesterase
MFTLDGLLGSLTLEPSGPDRYTAPNIPVVHGVVFGGQLMAQSAIAGSLGHAGMPVKSLHTVFVRAAKPDLPVEIVVEPMQSGRSFASSTVSISQGDRLCTRSIVLLSADEPDLIRHGDGPPRVSTPDDGTLHDDSAPWKVRVVGDVDISDPDAVGPAELDVWTRIEGAPDDPLLDQALLAFTTDGFLIGTAMRPHAGVGQAQAHRTLSTGVISHTITFHEPAPASDWMLLSHTSPYAGKGRCYGHGDVFRPDGQVAASFVQVAMVRPMPDRSGAL